ncbi:hypothetical protein [Pseudorhodoferax sp. Leaf265]|uniref:hypothetical protein n=1 Tax=Pseudorhodoferax sp. Leaf265 TaxID=1736315 RepID=UPI0012E95580|nr:hypothetical protein [Pseudorhodoferax sp. Leaf265]
MYNEDSSFIIRIIMKKAIVAATLLSVAAMVHAAQNYADRKAHIVNVSPHVELTQFTFSNEDRDRGRGLSSDTRFIANYSWKNTSQQPIIALEIVMLKYDAFDERLIGSRFIVQGTNSANWSPLQPGQSSSDGSIGFRDEDVYTGIAYVRRVRLSDGSVWRVDDSKLLQELKKVAPSIRNPGNLAPDAKPPAKE